MLAPSGDLLRAGIGLKVNQVKRATQSYLRDRTNHATGTVASYAVAAGLFAAAGVFVIAAVFVGRDPPQAFGGHLVVAPEVGEVLSRRPLAGRGLAVGRGDLEVTVRAVDAASSQALAQEKRIE